MPSNHVQIQVPTNKLLFDRFIILIRYSVAFKPTAVNIINRLVLPLTFKCRSRSCQTSLLLTIFHSQSSLSTNESLFVEILAANTTEICTKLN